MNSMMPISHRLYAAAIAHGVLARKSRGAASRDVILPAGSIDAVKAPSAGRGHPMPRPQYVAWASALRPI